MKKDKSVLETLAEQEEKLNKITEYIEEYEEMQKQKFEAWEKMEEEQKHQKQTRKEFESFLKNADIQLMKNESIEKFKQDKRLLILIFILSFTTIFGMIILMFNMKLKVFIIVEIIMSSYVVMLFIYVLKLTYIIDYNKIQKFSIFKINNHSTNRITKLPGPLSINERFFYNRFFRLYISVFAILSVFYLFYLVTGFTGVITLNIINVFRIVTVLIIYALNIRLFSKYNIVIYSGYFEKQNEKTIIYEVINNKTFYSEETFKDLNLFDENH